ncbi:MAG: hypothetical protein ACOYN0_15150, partial [Phycisphaerales bacterium]
MTTMSDDAAERVTRILEHMEQKMQKHVRVAERARGHRSWSGLSAAGALMLAASITMAQPVLITAPVTLNCATTCIRSTAGGPCIPLATAEITVRGTTLTTNGRFSIASLTLETGASGQPAIVTHSPQATCGSSGTDVVRGMELIISGNLNVNAGCRIDVSGMGSPAGAGPGAGASFQSYGGGGGYGGAGGDASGSSRANGVSGFGGQCYGFLATETFAPSAFGSGGGDRWSGAQRDVGTGGAGGGAARLIVTGTSTINGTVVANGADGGSRAGGGSGGSVYLNTAVFGGSGQLSANGGTGYYEGGGGGGGRVAVIYSSRGPVWPVASAIGGPGYFRGGAGTTYDKLASSIRGTLTFDNGNTFGENSEIYGPVTLNANVVVRRGARLGPAHLQ